MDHLRVLVLCAVVAAAATQVTGSDAVIQPSEPTLFETQTLNLSCSSSLLPPLNFTWSRDNVPLSETSDTLILSNVSSTWDGDIVNCTVSNGGQSVSGSVTLTVYTRLPTFIVHPIDQMVSPGGSFNLTCSAVGLPSPDIQWYKDGSVFLLPPTFGRGEMISFSDITDNQLIGDYECRALNIHGHVFSHVATVTALFLPEISVQPVMISVLNNTAAQLNCSATGMPPPVITWTHNGDMVAPDDRISIHDNGSLIFDVVYMIDMGNYRCQANNSLGTADSDDAFLMVDLFPLFRRTPVGKSATLGSSAFLNCSAIAIPEADYVWTVDGNEVEIDDDRLELDNGTLIFNEVYRNDSGDYVCQASNEYGEITSGPAQLSVVGPPLPPFPTLTDIGSSWLALIWSPHLDSNPPVTSYNIRYRLSFQNVSDSIKGISSQSINITSLYPNAEYIVQVVSVSPSGSSEPSPPVGGTQTLQGIPEGEGIKDIPEDLQIKHTSPDQLMVHWTVPEELLQTSYNKTRVYLIPSVGQQDMVVMETTDSPIHLTALTPATSYHLEIAFLFIGGHVGRRLRRDVTTMDGIPSSPEDLNVTVDGPHTLTLTWSPPSQPDGTIIAYTITYLPEGGMMVVEGDETEAELTGLTPYTLYTVSISANTSAGEGPAMSLEIRTAEGVPPSPNELTVEPINSTALLLSWEQIGNVSGILVQYVIKYNQLHHGGHPQEATVDSTRNSLVLSELKPYTVYRVMVAGETGAGVGNFSNRVDSRTFGDVPTSIPTLISVVPSCPSDLIVSWSSITERELNGPPNETRLVISLLTDSENNVTVEYSQETNYTLRNVTPYTNHTVAMAIRNLNGTGDFSDPISVISCDGFADPPSDITVETISSTSIRVTWNPVVEVPGILVNYAIIRTDDNAESADSFFSPDSVSEVLTGLTPYSLYNVSVASVTRSGRGSLSQIRTVRTFSDVPTSIPTLISVTPSCPSDLIISWSSIPERELNGPPNETRLVISLLTDSENNVTVEYSQETTYRLTGLTIDTMYTVSIALSNDNGTGPFSSNLTTSTLPEGLSTPPVNVQATPTSASSIRVTWDRPLNPNGDPIYIVYYRLAGADNALQIVTAEGQSANITELTTFTMYEIAVSANTMCGATFSDSVNGTSGEAPPTSPSDLTLVAVLSTAVVVQWSQPEMANGIVTSYMVSCGGSPDVTVVDRKYECTGLAPRSKVNISVTAINGAGEGPPVSMTTTTSCEDLQSLVSVGDNGLIISLTAPSTDDCTRTIVQFVLVLVQELVPNGNGGYFDPARSLADYSLDELVALTNTRSKRQTNDLVYIAANVSEVELQGGGFAVGDGMDYDGFTNHPLKPGVFYNVGLRGVVAGATTPMFTESTQSKAITAAPPPVTTPTIPSTTTPFPILAVAVSAGVASFVLFAIFLLICIICACSYCNRRANKYAVSSGTTGAPIQRGASFRLSSRKKTADPIDEFRSNHRTEALEDHPPVPVMGFLNKLMVMRTNDNQLFLEEFGSITMTPQSSTEVANQTANKQRNRYNNILPYDNNRVKLKSHGGSDYINASYCSGYMKNKIYIATQGPKADTIGDFWRLVWEENCRTIVMLTNVTEKGKTKCDMYWPRDLGCTSLHGHIEVVVDDVTQLADFTIRSFNLHKAGSSKEGRQVRQFHFTSWPDHGVPQYATAMLSMLRRVRSYHGKLNTGPMLVHCSAGVGRTGTFIVIDTMLERLKNGDSLIDVYGHVSLLRTQRNYMVQTEDQYFFIYEALAEALLCGNTEVSLEKLGGYVSELSTVIPGDESDMTHIELQFKRLAIDKNDPFRYVTANKDSNKAKNRLVNILPYENNRVCLEYMHGVDGSDYINASHIDSYHNRRAFIATQGPLANTAGDFWRMVWQYNSPVIVMLTETVEKGMERCHHYWPTEVLQSERYDRFNVELAVERKSEHYTFRDLQITDTQSGHSRVVSHFQFHGWPEVGIPSTPTILLDFIREVQKMYSILSTRAPITVHCSSGVGRTGVFITLHITLERMATEGMVDIFQTVKNLRIQRPAMVQTLQQYLFCYESALNYLESSDLLLTQQRTLQSAPSNELTRKKSLRHTPPSQTSPSKSSAGTRASSLTRNTPTRTDSFKGSTRNFELSNNGSHIYGGSDATSTFGSHHTSANRTNSSSLNGSQVHLSGSQIHLGSQNHGSQTHLAYGNQTDGSQMQLNSQSNGSQGYLHMSGGHMRHASTGGVLQPVHQLAESQRYSNSSAQWGSFSGDTQ